jgi:Rrf2 family transcriptional regulator, iron-sulfur cluster assembly transcription factor
VSVADIIRAVDEPIDATSCGGKENCHDDQKCITHDLWAGLNEHIFEFLSSVKLATLVAKQKERHAGQTGPVQILDMRDKRPAPAEPGAVTA